VFSSTSPGEDSWKNGDSKTWLKQSRFLRLAGPAGAAISARHPRSSAACRRRLCGQTALSKNVGAYAKAHHWTFPNIEYVLWAIILGLLISNTVGVPELFRTGVATYEFWLKAGIVLLGARFLLGDVLKLAESASFSWLLKLSFPRIHDFSRPPVQAQAQTHDASCRWLGGLRRQRHHRH